eukprot:CAMPEP_0180650996 /NCGR_PEP_ID=MMETSP1037_2-20121125/52588_1 /TAXON_ID=632150 /ORGANISM="Azadinium spinosum, Strain 3D9" /LENGTH=124 /DNA_ID=CAMNT_0022676493 /DNA_START=68 /DNA_END=442 /DNA_ORIENTATION=+
MLCGAGSLHWHQGSLLGDTRWRALRLKGLGRICSRGRGWQTEGMAHHCGDEAKLALELDWAERVAELHHELVAGAIADVVLRVQAGRAGVGALSLVAEAAVEASYCLNNNLHEWEADGLGLVYI